MDHAFWELFRSIFFLMRDFVIQDVAEMLQMDCNTAAQVLMDIAYAIKGKPVSDRVSYSWPMIWSRARVWPIFSICALVSVATEKSLPDRCR